MRIDRRMPWLGFPPAVDLANTVAVSPGTQVDLLEEPDDIATWAAAQVSRLPGVETALRDLPRVRQARAAVRDVLFAVAEGRPPPTTAVRRVNELSAQVPVALQLVDGRVETVALGTDDTELFLAAVARSAIEVAVQERESLSICRAPSCGMLFLRHDLKQRWCCAGCGNRARVARHAVRRRAAAGD